MMHEVAEYIAATCGTRPLKAVNIVKPPSVMQLISCRLVASSSRLPAPPKGTIARPPAQGRFKNPTATVSIVSCL
jgi:hypothetical protein